MRKALLFALAAPLLACNVNPRAEVAAFGDSVTWGYGDLPGGWVRHLEQRSGYTIANLGVPGERADGAAGRIRDALRTVPRAKVVLVLHGGNDWVKAFRSDWCNKSCEPEAVDGKYDAIGAYLRKVRRAIAAAGRKPVFLTYWPDAPGKCPKYDAATWVLYQRHRERLNAEIVETAAEHGDAVVDLGDLQDFGADGDFFDCLHPSAQGYEKIADRILDDVDSWAPPEPSPRDLLQFARWP